MTRNPLFFQTTPTKKSTDLFWSRKATTLQKHLLIMNTNYYLIKLFFQRHPHSGVFHLLVAPRSVRVDAAIVMANTATARGRI